MKLTNLQKIGTTFKKENIFLATLVLIDDNVRKKLKTPTCEGVCWHQKVEEILSKLVTVEEVDIFYKDENGYTRFVEEGPETFVGDDSDEKGFIRNIVPIWEYYSEEEVKEVLVNDTFISIVCTTIEPLENYNDDYNG